MSSEKQELYLQRINELRREFEYYVIDGYIVPVVDAYGSEYPPACNRRLEWMTGFTGSAGIALILQNEAALFKEAMLAGVKYAEGRGVVQFEATDSASEKLQWCLQTLKLAYLGLETSSGPPHFHFGLQFFQRREHP